MKLFRSKKNEAGSKATDTAAGWIAAGIRKLQEAWAKGMSRLFAKLSPPWAKTILIGSFLLMAGYSLVLITSAFSKPDQLFRGLSVHLNQLPVAKPLSAKPALPDKLPFRIRKFRQYLDSLATSPNGRKVRDSLLKKRPGLLDSLQQIENIYCR